MASLERNKVDAEGPDLALCPPWVARASCSRMACWPKTASEDAEKAGINGGLKQASSADPQSRRLPAPKSPRPRRKVAQATAALERADEDLRNFHHRQPHRRARALGDVEVATPSVHTGARFAATLLFTLGGRQRRLRAPARSTSRHRQSLSGPAHHITVESFRDRKFEGKVYQISPLGVERRT